MQQKLTLNRAKKIRCTISVSSSVISLLVWSLDTPLHPQFPALFFVYCFFAFLPLVIGPTRVIRFFGIVLFLFMICSAIERYDNYVRFYERGKEFSSYTESLHTLQAKMITFCQGHPEISLTNVSEYVRVGALAATDTNFLLGSEVVVYPYTATINSPFIEIKRKGMKTVVSQDGIVTWYKNGK